MPRKEISESKVGDCKDRENLVHSRTRGPRTKGRLFFRLDDGTLTERKPDNKGHNSSFNTKNKNGSPAGGYRKGKVKYHAAYARNKSGKGPYQQSSTN